MALTLLAPTRALVPFPSGQGSLKTRRLTPSFRTIRAALPRVVTPFVQVVPKLELPMDPVGGFLNVLDLVTEKTMQELECDFSGWALRSLSVSAFPAAEPKEWNVTTYLQEAVQGELLTVWHVTNSGSWASATGTWVTRTPSPPEAINNKDSSLEFMEDNQDNSRIFSATVPLRGAKSCIVGEALMKALPEDMFSKFKPCSLNMDVHFVAEKDSVVCSRALKLDLDDKNVLFVHLLKDEDHLLLCNATTSWSPIKAC